MKWEEYKTKQEVFVDGLIEAMKTRGGGIAKRVVVCPCCDADLTEWWARRQLADNFDDLMMKQGVLPEPMD